MKDFFSLKGKTAIVTGVNGGIGKGIARGFAAMEGKIVVAARKKDKIDSTVSDIRDEYGVEAIGIVTDVRDEESVNTMTQEAIERFGTVNILVNNAGINIRKMPQDYTMEEWDEVLQINLRSAFLCSKAAYPHESRWRGKDHKHRIHDLNIRRSKTTPLRD
jgi:2-deoxy-D-gluconate 3-dehydrogenase